jgi:hypothetical protein
MDLLEEMTYGMYVGSLLQTDICIVSVDDRGVMEM